MRLGDAYCAAVRQVWSSRAVRSQTFTTPSPDPDATEFKECLSYGLSACHPLCLGPAENKPCTCYTRPGRGLLPAAQGRASQTCVPWTKLDPAPVVVNVCPHNLTALRALWLYLGVRTNIQPPFKADTTYYSRARSKGWTSGARFRGARWTSEPGACWVEMLRLSALICQHKC